MGFAVPEEAVVVQNVLKAAGGIGLRAERLRPGPERRAGEFFVQLGPARVEQVLAGACPGTQLYRRHVIRVGVENHRDKAVANGPVAVAILGDADRRGWALAVNNPAAAAMKKATHSRPPKTARRCIFLPLEKKTQYKELASP